MKLPGLAFACLATVLAAAISSTPAQACRFLKPIELDRVVHADAVLIGRLSNYELVRDEAFRERMLAMPGLTDEMRALYEGSETLLPDYARFTFAPTDTLLGTEPASFTVTWDNSTFGEPDMLADGEYLIAISHPDPGAQVSLTRAFGHPVLFQRPCSQAFIFALDDPEVAEIRTILGGI